MAITNLTGAIYSTTGTPYDSKLAPVATYADLANVANGKSTQRWAGLTITVLNTDTTNIPCEYQLVGGKTNAYWRIKSPVTVNTIDDLASLPKEACTVGLQAIVRDDNGNPVIYLASEIGEEAVVWKKNTGGSGESYDDTELRNRIISLEERVTRLEEESGSTDIKELVEALKDKVDALDAEVSGLTEEHADIWAEILMIEDALESGVTREYVDEAIADEQDRVDALLEGKADKADVDAIEGALSGISAEVEAVKSDIEDIEEDIATIEVSLADKADAAEVNTAIENINAELAEKASVQDLEEALSGMGGDIEAVEEKLDAKADAEDLAALEERVNTELAEKASVQDLENAVSGISSDIEAIEEALDAKADAEDVTALEERINAELAEKVDQEYLNELETAFAEELDTKADLADIVELEAEVESRLSGISEDIAELDEKLAENYYSKEEIYSKEETYTKEEVNTLVDALPKFTITVVDELPASGESNVVYLVRALSADVDDLYEEYIFINEEWELLGTQRINVDSINARIQAVEDKEAQDIAALEEKLDLAEAKEIEDVATLETKINDAVSEYLDSIAGLNDKIDAETAAREEDVEKLRDEIKDIIFSGTPGIEIIEEEIDEIKEDVDALATEVDELSDKIEILNGGEDIEGSVDNKIKEAHLWASSSDEDIDSTGEMLVLTNEGIVPIEINS